MEKLLYLACLIATICLCACEQKNTQVPINREALVQRHNPEANFVDPVSPFTVGNGKFAFTADVTGLQSLANLYYSNGIPLETKARWAWHSRPNPDGYSLENASEEFDAYGRNVSFPSNMDSPAGQWLRQNPHDLPLARLSLQLNGESILPSQLSEVNQHLNLWNGILTSHYKLDGREVSVTTASHGERDILAFDITSPMVASGELGMAIRFPRGYDLSIKNTPDMLWSKDDEHTSTVIFQDERSALFQRNVDDARHYIRIGWSAPAELTKVDEHFYRLLPLGEDSNIQYSVEFSQAPFDSTDAVAFNEVINNSATHWKDYWMKGAAIDFSGSTDHRAYELERRVVLSQYLMGVQARAEIPAQETGLTSSSWYGKHHTEMAWWHSAHWALWGREQQLERVLDWYIEHLESAQALARERGLKGARWAKMVGPENRESPGGNPLIIWNQPQVIHLAELLYQIQPSADVLNRYAELVEQTALGLESMLVWNEQNQRWSLEPPIWIAQEIYDPKQTRNPAFELAYWRFGLQTAQQWRTRQGKPENADWTTKVNQLAGLPRKDSKYVAIESIPDTFENIESRRDHPTMLAPLGLLNDETVNEGVMENTLFEVLKTWDWETKIWGWDYPMIAMTAARLGMPEVAVDVLLMDAPHNYYLPNGHCPQQGASLPVYLPANGALLSAVAMMAAGWEGAPGKEAPGFPANGQWNIKAEGFYPML